MFRRVSPVVLVLMVLAVLALPSLACGFSFSSASIENIVMATDVQGENFDPVGVTTVYTPEQPAFHAVVTVKNAPDETKVRAVWKVVDVGDIAEPGTVIDETEIVMDGSRNLHFALENSASYWPAGTYSVEIFLNDESNRVVEFAVEGEPPVAEQPASDPAADPAAACPAPALPELVPSSLVSEVVLAEDVAGDKLEPVNLTTVFGESAMFHAVVKTQDAPTDTSFVVRWYATDVGDAAPCDTFINEYELVADGTRYLDFNLAPETGWPMGQYRAELYVNGTASHILMFEVQ